MRFRSSITRYILVYYIISIVIAIAREESNARLRELAMMFSV